MPTLWFAFNKLVFQEQIRGAEPTDGLTSGPVQHPSAENQSGVFFDGRSRRDGGGSEAVVWWDPLKLEMTEIAQLVVNYFWRYQFSRLRRIKGTMLCLGSPSPGQNYNHRQLLGQAQEIISRVEAASQQASQAAVANIVYPSLERSSSRVRRRVMLSGGSSSVANSVSMEDLQSLEASGVHGKSKMSYREVLQANSEALVAAQVIVMFIFKMTQVNTNLSFK